MEHYERLRQARTEANFTSAAAAARALGVSYPTYSGHENGNRDFRSDPAALELYARRYKVNTAWLAYGRGPKANGSALQKVPIVGYVGAGQEVVPFEAEEIGETEAPTSGGDGFVAVIVRGHSMYPVYRERDLIFYEIRTHAVPDLIGRECVVKLADGRMLVKVLRRGAEPGFYNLESFNAPLIENVVLEWASPVRWVEKK